MSPPKENYCRGTKKCHYGAIFYDAADADVVGYVDIIRYIESSHGALTKYDYRCGIDMDQI